MRLIVFDIDGTVTDTNEVDANCFVEALATLYGITTIDGDWEKFPHATDSCIFGEIFREHHGREASASDVERFREFFLGLMRQAEERDPIRVIPGATEAVLRLANLPGYQVAFATGCWKSSARWKLGGARLELERYPHATADDAPAREAIMLTAINRAKAQAAKPIDGVVYVGDAAWDARACKKMGLPLLGIGQGPQAERLRALGVEHVLPDYRDELALAASLDALFGRAPGSRSREES